MRGCQLFSKGRLKVAPAGPKWKRESKICESAAAVGSPVQWLTAKNVKLWDYTKAIVSGELKELAPLLILSAREKDEKVLAKSRELILSSEDERWRADALSLAVTVAGRYFPKEFLLKFFNQEVKMLREASIVQDWINEGMEPYHHMGPGLADVFLRTKRYLAYCTLIPL